MSEHAWADGYVRREFDVDGSAISYLELTESKGHSGAPIVLVHGLQGSALEHCEVGRLLGDRGPVYLLDLRAHGRSPAGAGKSAGSMDDQVAVVIAFLRDVVRRQAVLIGNSFGAMVCARVALAAPDNVFRLVLIGPAVRPAKRLYDPNRLLQLLIVKPRFVRDLFDRQVAEGKRPEHPGALLANATPYLDLIPTSHVEALLEEPDAPWVVGNEAGRAAVWRSRNDALVQLARPRRWLKLLRKVPMRALWLHGADDPLMPAATAAEMRELLPTWHVETVAATGHVPHLERPEWTAGRIGAWLET